MFSDPFIDPSVLAYLEASARYDDAVQEMTRLGDTGQHEAFKRQAARARVLGLKAEDAHEALVKQRTSANDSSRPPR